MLRKIIAALAVATSLLLVVCKNADPDVGSDNNIAASLNAANAAEIQAGMLAQSQATDANVKTFAGRMVTEHAAAQQRQSALFARLGITPVDDANSQQLKSDAQALLERLRMRSGSAFDLAYMDDQIAMHQSVLALLDGKLIPAVTQDELRAELTMTRSAVALHLQSARAVRAMLGADADGGVKEDGGQSDGGLGDGGRGDLGETDGGPIDGGKNDGGPRDGGPDGDTVHRRL